MSSLIQDLRYCIRSLRNAPGFALVAIAIIAIGIGASTTIFSWVRAVLLTPLPGAGDPQSVVALESLGPDGHWYPTSYIDFRDLRTSCTLIQSMSVTKPMALPVGDKDSVERVWGEVVSGNFFDLLEVRPEAGRFFSSAEVDYEQNAHPLLVISHAYWESHFNGDPYVIGSTLRIGHFPYTIIGVTPKGFQGSMPGISFEMWAPATMYGQLSATGDATLLDRKWRTFRVLARLAPGVSIGQARAEVESHAKDMARDNADTNQGMSATLLPLWQSHYGIQDSLLSPLGVLMAACIVVLLIVCANVANLLLVRATARQREFSVRLALGASRLRLVRHVLTESLSIAIAGSLAGFTAAMWLSGSLGSLLPRSSRSSFPALVQLPVDARVLLFAIALACVISVIAGITPALQAANGNVNAMLKEGGHSSSSAPSNRLRGLFVTSEMALAVIAIIGAGLFLASFRHVSEIRTGFESDHIAIAQLDLSAASYSASQAESYYQRFTVNLERQPGVTAVAYADYIPLSVVQGSWEDLQVQGYLAAPGEDMKIYRSLISPGYFRLMKIPILDGRDFTAQDTMTSDPVMIVNQEFGRRFVRGGMAVGRRVHGWGKWFRIVGVVQNTKIHRPTEGPTPYFYVPISQIYRPEMGLAFYVRTSGSMNSAITALQHEARAADPFVPIFDASSLDDFMSASLFPQKMASSLLSVLGVVSLLLAAVGLYGVMAYSVAQRTGEIGIRMALGAQPIDVVRLVVRQGMIYALIGLAAGSLAAAALARVVSHALPGISPVDPSIYTAAMALTILIALTSIALPAWRAVGINPLAALRHE